MVFTSWPFFWFFLAVMAGLWVLRARSLRHLWLLAASCYFYAYWNPLYLILLLTPSIIDYVCADYIDKSNDEAVRKRWLVFSVVSNLALLGYFKYTNFFLGNFASLTGLAERHLDILLPVGISFYTFKTMSYTIDVYRREIPACKSLWRYAMFVTYFPELVAGPIVRASVFLPQMTRQLRPSWVRVAAGMQIVLLGVTKKILIADRLAIFVDSIFEQPGLYDPLTVASAVVAYSIQIYCDFSGYSDMAIGISRIIGFDLPENFNMPYAAVSVVEFWRRWHITLSQWLRDYLYIPLGGNRGGRLLTYRNLMLTMLLGGLWHGASWNFVCWGGLHGLALAANHLWTRDWKPFGGHLPSARTKILRWLVTYVYVCITWVFFRSADFPTSLIILRKLAGLEPGGVSWFYSPLVWIIPAVVVAHGLGLYAAKRQSAPGASARRTPPPNWLRPLYEGNGFRFAVRPHPAAGQYVLLPLPGLVGGFLVTVWLLAIVLFATFDARPFIYFQF